MASTTETSEIERAARASVPNMKAIREALEQLEAGIREVLDEDARRYAAAAIGRVSKGDSPL